MSKANYKRAINNKCKKYKYDAMSLDSCTYEELKMINDAFSDAIIQFGSKEDSTKQLMKFWRGVSLSSGRYL